MNNKEAYIKMLEDFSAEEIISGLVEDLNTQKKRNKELLEEIKDTNQKEKGCWCCNHFRRGDETKGEMDMCGKHGIACGLFFYCMDFEHIIS